LRTTRRTPTRDTNSTTLSNSEEPSKPKKKKRIISFIYTAFMLALPFCLYSFYAFCTS
jgi:flagellar basal body-associated protein FliL